MMRPTITRLQVGGSRAVAFDQDGAGWAIVLPGADYSTQAPLLWYARRAALAAGRNVLAVSDAFDGERDDPLTWVEARAEATLQHVRPHDPHPVLITKSLTSLAAPFAARERLPAVWLTPLIAARGTSVADQVLAGLRSGTEPRLLIGGSEDPTWDDHVASTLSAADVLELEGADHSLEVRSDVARSLDNLRVVTDAVNRFIAALG